MSNDSIYNNRIKSNIKVNTQSNPLDNVTQFAHDVVRGAHDTGRSYSTDLYDDAKSMITGSEIQERSYVNDTMLNVGIRGATEGNLHGARDELDRRYRDEPGRLVGEAAAEVGIAIATSGGSAAFKGFKIGVTGTKSLRMAGAAQGSVGYTRKTGYFRKGVEQKFIGNKRTTINTINHKGVKRTKNKRTNMFDRIEKGGISMGEKLGRGLGVPQRFANPIMMSVRGGSGMNDSFSGGGTIGARIAANNNRLTSNSIVEGTRDIDIQRLQDYPTRLRSDINDDSMNAISWNQFSGQPVTSGLGGKYPHGVGGSMWNIRPATLPPNTVVSGARSILPKGFVSTSSLIPQPNTTEEGMSVIMKTVKYADTTDASGKVIKGASAYPSNLAEVSALYDTPEKRIRMATAKFKGKYANDDEYVSSLQEYWAPIIKHSNLPNNKNTSIDISTVSSDFSGSSSTASFRQGGQNYTFTSAAQPEIMDTTKGYTEQLLNKQIFSSHTQAETTEVAMEKTQLLFAQQLSEQGRQAGVLKKTEDARKLRNSELGLGGKVISRSYREDGTEIIAKMPSNRDDYILSQGGVKMTKVTEPAFEMPMIGTGSEYFGVDTNNVQTSAVSRLLGNWWDITANIPGTRVESKESVKWTGIKEVINGGQTGVDQASGRIWADRGGITGGTMPSEFVTEKVVSLTGYGNTYTAAKTQRLGKDQIFVYGANKDYLNWGGAAGDAAKYFGAGGARTGPKGGPGIVGQSYGVITKIAPDRLKESYYSGTESGTKIVTKEVKKLVLTMKQNPDKEFIVTEFGTKMAGFKTSDIVKMFGKDIIQPNAVLPKAFVDKLSPKLKAKYLKSRKSAVTGDMEGALYAEKYGLSEGADAGSVSKNYAARMSDNVINSDGTIIFGSTKGKGTGGTIREAKKQGRPVLINPKTSAEVNAWAKKYNIERVNVAGTRASDIKKNNNVISRMEKIMGGIKMGKGPAPEGYLPRKEKQFINPFARDAGTGLDINSSNITEGDTVFGWSRTVNPRGKMPQTNKPEKQYITAEDGEYRLEYDEEFQVRQDMDFAGGKNYWESTEYDPSKMFTETGMSSKIAMQAGEMSGMSPTNPSKLKDVITGDESTFRFAMGLPDQNKASQEAFDKTFNNMTSPAMLRNYGNWRNAKIRSPEFRQAIKDSRYGNSPVKDNLTYGKIYGANFDKWYNDTILSTTYSPGIPRRSEELGMGRVRQPGDVRTSVFGMFENPVVGRGAKTDRTAEDWADSTGVSRESLARLTMNPGTDGFDAWALVDGKRRVKPDSYPYALADKVRKAKKEGNRVPVGGMGGKIFDYDDAAVGNAPKPFSLPTNNTTPMYKLRVNNKVKRVRVRPSRGPVRQEPNISSITRFTDNPNNPFSYPVGSAKRKAALRKQKRLRDAILQEASGNSFWAVSTPVNKKKKKFKPAGPEDTSNFYQNFGDGDSFDPRGLGGGMS
jgi:hypothetical protein